MLPTCDKLDVLVDGRFESNRPAFAECFLEWPLVTGENEAADGDVALVGFSERGDMPLLAWASLGE